MSPPTGPRLLTLLLLARLYLPSTYSAYSTWPLPALDLQHLQRLAVLAYLPSTSCPALPALDFWPSRLPALDF